MDVLRTVLLRHDLRADLYSTQPSVTRKQQPPMQKRIPILEEYPPMSRRQRFFWGATVVLYVVGCVAVLLVVMLG